ncbi:uncharacterized protein LOC117639088 isoform X3 [Thrips palmi]|uniref:Uncharacterized protein LOC117639088 isoform X3 n=1 Tax=Thrips palmi TaxID=161013 RepID=A0A6P8XU05_THRPL|nr:uncharacterized protein LOC117639088 isoform X3 [Thrips palmi]
MRLLRAAMHFGNVFVVVPILIFVVAAATALPTKLTADPPICDLFYSYSLQNGRCNGDEKLPVPCEGWCHMYIQCTNGVPASKGTKCGGLFHVEVFDYETRECKFKEFLISKYCDWWKTINTTSTQH